MSKQDIFPPARMPNHLCDLYGQYIGFGSAGGTASGTGVSLTSVSNSALFSAVNESLSRSQGSGSNTVWTFSSWIYKCESKNQVFLQSGGSPAGQLGWDTSDRLYIYNGATVVALTTQLFRDIGWYHIHIAYNTSATGTGKVQLSVNGSLVSVFTTDNRSSAGAFNGMNQSGQTLTLGNNGSVSDTICLSGYMAETVILDGTAAEPTSFGAYDSSGLYWTPLASETIKALTFGTNGFYLDNTTNAQTDASGEGNNFTNNNTVVTTTHTPTNIFGLANGLVKSAITFTNGNRTVATTTSANSRAQSTLPIIGKMKAEFTLDVGTVGLFGIRSITQGTSIEVYYYSSVGTVGGATGSAGATWTTNDVITILVDDDAGTIEFKKNNTSQGGARTINASGYTAGEGDMCFEWGDAGTSSAVTATIAVESGDWAYSDTATFLECSTESIAAATTRTASNTNKYFQTVLYEGSGAGQRVGAFQPFTDTFTVAKSALFDSANSETLTRTPSGAGNRRTWTFSTWIKFAPTTGSFTIFNGYGSASDTGTLDILWSSNKIYLRGWSTNYVYSNMLFEDESQWGNLVMTLDTTQSTSSDRIKGYWNGVELTWGGTSYPSLNAQLGINQAVLHSIGAFNNASGFMGAYLAETVFVDGTALTPSSFGQTDTSTNRWIPKAVSGLSLGTNGFYLDYSNSSDLGEDQTGSNDFTNNNTVTQTTDSPTTNITVLSPNRNSVCVGTLSNGNRTVVTGSSQYGPIWTEMALSSGKWYWEGVWTVGNYAMIGITTGKATSTTQQLGYLPDDVGLYSSDGKTYTNNVAAASAIGTYAVNDVMGIALDMDTKTVKFYKNNSLLGTVNLPSNDPYYPAFADWVNSQTVTWVTRFASADWSYSAPTDHIAITQDNMTSSDQFISAFSWIKNRDATDNYMLFDRVRGVTKDIHSNTADIEVTNANTLQSFLSAGVQIGDDVEVNTANESYVLWNWMMEATGSGSSNEDGSINTTSTLVDTTLGLSISKYTGTGSNATVGHGLGVAPKMMLIKNLGVTDAWAVYYGDNTDYIVLNTSAATVDDATMWNDTTPTSSVFSIGSNHQVNASSENYIAYCFAPSQFISIGSYEGNGNADGTFATLLNSLGIPIKPVWAIFKNIDNGVAGSAWSQEDTARSPINVMDKVLSPSANNAEGNWADMDFVTGGIKQRGTNLVVNENAKTIIYMAIGTPIIDTDGRIIAGR